MKETNECPVADVEKCSSLGGPPLSPSSATCSSYKHIGVWHWWKLGRRLERAASEKFFLLRPLFCKFPTTDLRLAQDQPHFHVSRKEKAGPWAEVVPPSFGSSSSSLFLVCNLIILVYTRASIETVHHGYDIKIECEPPCGMFPKLKYNS